jgi:hypothetical protein
VQPPAALVYHQEGGLRVVRGMIQDRLKVTFLPWLCMERLLVLRFVCLAVFCFVNDHYSFAIRRVGSAQKTPVQDFRQAGSSFSICAQEVL